MTPAEARSSPGATALAGRPLLVAGLATALLGAVLVVSASAAIQIEIKEVGLKRHHSAVDVPLLIEVKNPLTVPFEGKLSAHVSIRTGMFYEEEEKGSFSQAVSVPPSSAARVCFPLPARYLEEYGTLPVEFRLLDSYGRIQATKSLDPKAEPIEHSAEKTIGVLGSVIEDIKIIQNLVLFPERDEKGEFFEQPSTKFLYLPPDSTPCWQAYRALQSLVIGMSVDSLDPALREALRMATVAGLSIVVIDSYPGNAAFLDEFTRGKAGPAVAGRGTVQRVASLADREGFQKVHGAVFGPPGEKDRLASYRDSRTIGSIFDWSEWAESRSRKALPPAPYLLIGALAAYILLLGPVSFFALRARDRREIAWVTTPAIAAAFSLVLAVWIAFHQFHESEVDSATFLLSRDGQTDTTMDFQAILSSPRERTWSVVLRGDWAALESVAAHATKPYDLHTAFPRVEILNLRTPKWSGTGISTKAFARRDPPVKFSDRILTSLARVPFDEAVFVDSEGWWETANLPPGGEWKLDDPNARQDLRLLVRRDLHAWQRERTKDDLRLSEAVNFPGIAGQTALLKTVRAVFLGATREETVEIVPDQAPDVRKSWTVYFHVFPRDED